MASDPYHGSNFETSAHLMKEPNRASFIFQCWVVFKSRISQ